MANVGTNAANFVATNKSGISVGIFLIVCVMLLYGVYMFLYPTDTPGHTIFLRDEADAREPIALTNNTIPPIYTGGDFTLSFWIYIDDWNYKVTTNKLLFALSPAHLDPASRSSLVGVLTALQNGLMVRANTGGGSVSPTPNSGSGSGSGSEGPDLTLESNLQSALSQQSGGAGLTPCDIQTVPLQRWVNVTIVSSGRVLDVYMDGKLSRSCVLDNVVQVPRQKLQLRLGEFGGVYSLVQMWNVQLTPDVVYKLYQMGPLPATHSFLTRFMRFFNFNVTFSGPHDSQGPTNKPSTCSGDEMWTGAKRRLDSYL